MEFPVDTRERPDLAVGAVELRPVSPDYLATLGIPLVAGRDFGRDDVSGGEPVAIVNQTFAKRFWGDFDADGRTIQIGHYKDRWLRPELERQTRVIGSPGTFTRSVLIGHRDPQSWCREHKQARERRCCWRAAHHVDWRPSCAMK
jgi:hypothetical protein